MMIEMNDQSLRSTGGGLKVEGGAIFDGAGWFDRGQERCVAATITDDINPDKGM